MTIRVLVFTALIIVFKPALCQDETFGLLYNDGPVQEGYILFSPESNNSVYLIDPCGLLVNSWEFSEPPQGQAYLLEDGSVIRFGLDSIERRSWENELLWSYPMLENDLIHHHDIAPLPNGNVLCLLRKIYSLEEAIAFGRDSLMIDFLFMLDRIVEISPIGLHDAEILWEWNLVDHLIQDLDSTKLNYGNVEDHPELIDVNYNSVYSDMNYDWSHANGIDYNAELDQIIMSFRHTNEIYIIDHSTTTEEASGHIGGNADRGGDFLWRWGNPEVYRKGTASDLQLIKQHDARWVQEGFLDEGKISVFNNNGDDSFSYSQLVLLDVPWTTGGYEMDTEGRFLPEDYDWSWSGDIQGETLYASKKSGVESLRNGNMLLTDSPKGMFSEITKNGDVVWTYRNPSGPIIFDQYFEIELPSNEVFKISKYESDYPGLAQQDLTPTTTIENLNLLSDTCSMIEPLDVQEIELMDLWISNPVEDGHLWFSTYLEGCEISLNDISGRMVLSRSQFNGTVLPIDLNPGVYILNISKDVTAISKAIIVR